jgi:hypothetical protein
MACDLKPTRFIIPISSVRFDEVTVHENAALRQRFEAPGVDIRDSLLAAEVVQGPGRDDGMRSAGEMARPGLVHEICLGEGYPRRQVAKRSFRHLEENVGEVEAFIAEGFVTLQDIPRHVAGTKAEFKDVGVSGAKSLDLVQDHVEEGQPRQGRNKAIGPALHEGGIVEFVLGTNETSHGRSTPLDDACSVGRHGTNRSLGWQMRRRALRLHEVHARCVRTLRTEADGPVRCGPPPPQAPRALTRSRAAACPSAATLVTVPPAGHRCTLIHSACGGDDHGRRNQDQPGTLTLWAAVVAERLGYDADAAITLGRVVAGRSARAKARAIGIEAEHEPEDMREVARREEARHARAALRAVHLLGRDIAVIEGPEGLRAADDGKPASARSARAYVEKAFGADLAAAEAAMRRLAWSLSPEELNRVGFRLYERFRPEVPPGAQGWGAKGVLDLARIELAAG